MKVRIILEIEFDPETTQLSAAEHANEIQNSLWHVIGDGLLTAHEPNAEVERYWTRAEVV